MAQSSPQKFEALDSLRGAAAFSVFVYHFHSLSQDSSSFPSALSLIGKAGHIGLDVFFVLSGFLIFRSLYLHRLNKEYFVRRFLRIAPIYYFSLFFVLLLVNHSYFFSLQGWGNIVSHLFFLQSFSSATYYGINPVLWSLSVELIFYFFLPLFFWITKHKDFRILIGIVSMIVLCWIYRFEITRYYSAWDSTQRIIYTENFIGRLDQFALGMLASFLTLKVSLAKITSKAINSGVKTMALLLTGLGALGLLIGMSLFATYGSGFRDILSLQVFLHSFVGLSAATLIFGLSNNFEWISKVIGNKVFAFMGTISYSFYIWHYILTEHVLGFSTEHELVRYEFWIAFILTLLFSTLTYNLIEKKFLAKKKYASENESAAQVTP